MASVLSAPRRRPHIRHYSAKYISSMFLLLVPLLPLPIPLVSSLEDDLFYFTSFANVSEWAQVYNTCNIDFNFQYPWHEIYYLHLENEDGLAAPTKNNPLDKNLILRLSLDKSILPNTLSPIEIKHAETMCLTNSKRPKCASALPLDRPEKNVEPVVKIYNNPPPPLGSYSVSYGFQKNKECATTNDYAPCYVNPQFGRVRGVVLTANRQRLREIREQFTVEDPNQFISIIDGGSKNERKFTEAIFMGSSSEPVNCKTERTSHIIDGKCYPMEIYMYFVDETIPTMAMTTIFVVPVEFSDNENPRLRPVVNAVTRLYDDERMFLPKHDHVARDERMFHHTGPSTVFRHTHHANDTDYFYIPSSIDVENLLTAQMDHFERVLTYRAKTGFFKEKFFESRDMENKLIKTAAFATGVLFEKEREQLEKTMPPTVLPEYIDSSSDRLEKDLADPEYAESTYPAMTLAKLRVLRYLVSESYNAEVDYAKLVKKLKGTIKKLENHWPGQKILNNPVADQPAFTDQLKKYLEIRNSADDLIFDDRPTLSYEERITRLEAIRTKSKSIIDQQRAMFKNLPHFLIEVCKHFSDCGDWTEIEILNDTSWHAEGKKEGDKNHDGPYPRFLLRQMEKGVDIAKNRIARENDRLREELKEMYLEMGFKEEETPDVREVHSTEYLGTIVKKTMNYTFGNIYLLDKYVNHHLRTFFSSNEDHMFKYHEYKRKEGRKGNLSYPPKQILLGNLGISEEEFEDLDKLQPFSVSLKNDFQVSWLLPKGGGHYRYKGSSPVPPCYGVEDVMVFLKPITASRTQIQVLTTIPTSHIKSRDLWNTFGIRKKKRATNNKEAKNIYFDPRNHQFLVGDTYHENSVLAYQQRKNKKGGVGHSRSNIVIYFYAVIVSLTAWLLN